MWPLPLAALAGISGNSLFVFSAGAMLARVTHDLGWTRAQFMSGFTIQMLLSLVLAPIVGRLVTRHGPRRFLLIGIPLFVCGFAGLGLADGNVRIWWLLCALQAIAAAFISPAAWMTAIAGRFDASRGLAVATGLAGLGVAASLWPVATAFYVGHLGWRLAFGALVLSWGAVVWPLAWFFLRDPPAETPLRRAAPAPVLWPVLRSRTFLCLLASGSLFAGMQLGINLHLVPILQSGGFDLATAAGIASVAGMLTLGGRIATGWVLDHVAARIVGAVIFLLPAAASALLLVDGRSVPAAMAAAILFGMAAGGEVDLMTYIASRNLPRAAFASAYAIILAIFGAVASAGPLLAGLLFDRTGSYAPYLELVIPADVIGAAIICLLPSQRTARREARS